MKDAAVLSLGHSLYNAALLGLYHVLATQAKKKQDTEAEKLLNANNGAELHVPLRLIEGIETAWVDTMIARFEDTCACTELLDRFNGLLNMQKSGTLEDNVADDFLKQLESKVTSASYLSAAVICTEAGDSFHAAEQVKAVKKEKNTALRLEGMKPIMEYLERNKRVFLMKDIAYTVINSFWENKAFLNSNNNKTDMEKSFKESFSEPAVLYFSKEKKRNEHCIECSAPINFSEAEAMSWISDMGVDTARKRSNFWNFHPDSYICPLCALAYTCLPLGFQIVGRQGLFINNNDSFLLLRNTNETVSSTKKFMEITDKDKSQIKNPGAYKHFRAFAYTGLCESLRSENQLFGIQVIQRRKDPGENAAYSMELLSKDKLNVLHNCEKEFSSLPSYNIKLSKDNYINLSEETIDNLIAGRSQHGLIDRVLNVQIKEGHSCRILWNILKIQIYSRRGDNMQLAETAFKAAWAIASEGNKLRRSIGSAEAEIDNKLRGYIYKLLNSVSSRNRDGFIDTVSRMYIGANQTIPSGLFMKMFENDEAFVELGQAYILGLSGNLKKSDNAEEGDLNK